MKVRIKFSKHGPIKFIGHLDIMRFFQKAMRRSGIDIAYTGGFSPHQIMSFAAPLGVGLESNGEYMDVELHSMISSRDVVERLNEASVEGIRILSAKVLPENAGNAMASVAAAEYTVRFRDGRGPSCNMRDHLKDFYSQEKILITKETKNGLQEVNIRPGIYALDVVDECVHMLVDASSAGNIKPAYVIETFMAFCGQNLPENAYMITREETYLNKGTLDNPAFAPLDAIGSILE